MHYLVMSDRQDPRYVLDYEFLMPLGTCTFLMIYHIRAVDSSTSSMTSASKKSPSYGLSGWFVSSARNKTRSMRHFERMTLVDRLRLYNMALLTWVIVAVVIVAVIGLGVGTFYSGLVQGAEKIGSNPVVKDATAETKEFASNMTQKSPPN